MVLRIAHQRDEMVSKDILSVVNEDRMWADTELLSRDVFCTMKSLQQRFEIKYLTFLRL